MKVQNWRMITMTGAMEQYQSAVARQLKRIEEQKEAIAVVSERFAECILKDGLVHMYGSGHSRMGVEEMYPRYGSFPGFHPIVELSTSFYNSVIGPNGIRQSMYIENISGLAKQIFLSNDVREGDCFLLFTTSGTGNAVVELAEEAKKNGCFVAGITSLENVKIGTSKHPKGYKLTDVADVILDNGAVIGDAAVMIDGMDTPVGPLSTIGNSYLVNLIKVSVAEILVKNGVIPNVITHAHYVGKEKSEALFEASLEDYRRRLYQR